MRRPDEAAPTARTIDDLDELIPACRACPRLVAWREEVARTKRAAFRDQDYWGRPVPGFGPADAPLAIVGLAPAAHGGNRTGRMFTGDPSGDVLFSALHEVGLSSRPHSTGRDDTRPSGSDHRTGAVRPPPEQIPGRTDGARRLVREVYCCARRPSGRRARRLRLVRAAARARRRRLADPTSRPRVRARCAWNAGEGQGAPGAVRQLPGEFGERADEG